MAELDEVRALRAQGWTWRELSKEFNVNLSTLHYRANPESAKKHSAYVSARIKHLCATDETFHQKRLAQGRRRYLANCYRAMNDPEFAERRKLKRHKEWLRRKTKLIPIASAPTVTPCASSPPTP